MQYSRKLSSRFGAPVCIAAVLLFVFGGCATNGNLRNSNDSNAKVAESDVKIEALKFVERDWNAAGKNWNPDALAEIYTEDALFFGGRVGHSVGREKVHSYFESYRGILKSATLNLAEQHVIELAPNVFVAQGYGNFHFVLEKTGKQTDNVLRTTLVIVKRGDKWKVIDHHFSPTPEAPPIPK